jgi:hypothetical protein
VWIELSACGLSAEQRSATITLGQALDDHGQLLVEESTYIRSEVEAMRVLAMSLPNSESASLFNQGAYENLASGVEQPKTPCTSRWSSQQVRQISRPGRRHHLVDRQ